MFRFKSAELLPALFPTAYTRPLFRPNALPRSDNCGVHREVVLPPELSRSAVRLKRGICDVYLIGIDHYSQKTCEEVQSVINFLKPEVVFVGSLSRPGHNPNPSEVIYEYKLAYDEARKYGGKVILGDLPAFARLHDGRPAPLSFSFHSLFPHKASNHVIWTINFRDKFPRFLGKWLSNNLSFIKNIPVNQCDQYITAALLKIARENKSVVAIVNESHFLGVQHHWDQSIEAGQLVRNPWTFGDKVRLSALYVMGYISVDVRMY